MKQFIYTSFDSKATHSTNPWFTKFAPDEIKELLIRDAKKGHENILKSRDNIIYFLGIYNDDNMTFELADKPVEVAVIAQLILDYGGTENV